MEQLLKHFGLNDKEASVFLLLLRLGAQPVSVIAKEAGLPRSSMYFTIDKLLELGLAAEFQYAGVKHIKSIAVDELEKILNEKELKLKSARSVLKEKLPELKALENSLTITPKSRFFEGTRMVEKMYDEVLSEPMIRAFFHPELVKAYMPEYFIKVAETLRQKRRKAKELLVSCKSAYEYKKRFDCKRHQIRILRKGLSFSSDTIIAPTKIYMIAYGQGEVSAVEVANESLAITQAVLFDELWDMAKKESRNS